MCSASRRFQAVSIVVAALLCGTSASAQGVNFIHHLADPVPFVSMASNRVSCTTNSARTFPGSGASAGDIPDVPCDIPAVSTLPVDPCKGGVLSQAGCTSLRDLVREDLFSKGKEGQKILRARDRVLEILQSENSCSGWFRGKDSNPAATFATLHFETDHKGEDAVRESKNSGGLTIFRYPYVAKVIQADGSYGTITINARGAFFSALARIAEEHKDGGPLVFRDTRLLGVGPFRGDTTQSQVLTLLHEFGHIVDLLPTDEDDLNGRSEHNTEEVLRYCRAEVESTGKRAALAAAR